MASIYPNRKNGKIVSFKFKAYLGKDDNGKQLFRCMTWSPPKAMSEGRLLSVAQKQATIWERDALIAFSEEKKLLQPESITFKDFVEKKWLPNEIDNSEHRNSTIAFRRYLLKIIVDYLGELQLNSIDSSKIEEYMNYLKNTYKTKQNTTVSQQTMKHHYCTLNLIFDYALKLNYMTENPLLKVKSPKLTRHKVDAFSREEALELIKETDKLPIMQRLMYNLLLTTGIRRGECFGLQWGDVDFVNRVIFIRRNVTYTALNGITVGLPKTNTGIKTIPITDNLLSLLKEYKTSEETNFALYDDSFLFHSEQSSQIPRAPTYITKHMKRFMKRIGLPDMSPHDLRHTCATILLQSGADIKSVQDILGHSNASTTLNYYVRSDLETMRTATTRAFDFN